MASSAKSKPKTAAAQVDEQLARYRSMRHFDVTAEPKGDPGKAAAVSGQQFPFVVQKHAATRLHYDFRLGWNGVLKSWAVTKGPSYVPGDKRLAVQVEDHPMEYGGFEGTIPKGQYGGGTVMLWDEGTWEPHGDVNEMLARGNLKFRLNGKKLIGDWVLVRMGGRASAHDAKPNWLLIKEHDDRERTAGDPPITEEEPNSVLTGRDLDAIAQDEDHVWQSNAPEKKPAGRLPKVKPAPRPAAATVSFEPDIACLPAKVMPGFVSPQLASHASAPPQGDDWVHELKLDGYRVQAHVRSGSGQKSKPHQQTNTVQLFTRKGLDWTARMAGVAEALAALPVEDAILDGEVVVLNESGVSSFAELQASFDEHKRARLTYFVFDLLHLNGHDTRDLPLLQRKALLAELLKTLGESDTVVLSQHMQTDAATMFAEACRLGAEGIISKIATSKYCSGRSKTWLKLKCVLEQEFVVGGFTLPTNGSHGIGSLLLGYYEGSKLIYAGRTGTGFSHATSAHLRDRLEGIKQAKSPFAQIPREAQRDAHWVQPALVAQVEFRTWTADGLVRQSSFQGLREDKGPTEVVREPSSTKPAAPERDEVEAEASPPPAKAKSASTAHSQTDPAPVPVRLTHPEKVLDQQSGLTKQKYAEYLLAAAPRILPHIAGRPLSIIRCPNGTSSKCFFQRHLKVSLPKGVEGIDIREKNGDTVETYITLSTVEALVGLAQVNVLELHPWGSLNSNIELPDRLILDLDPDEAIPWPTLAGAAEEVRARLKAIGLKSFVKLTGGKGLHVVAPIRPQHAWPEVKEFAHQFVLGMEKENPRLYLTKMTKAARKNRIYLDYLRNERGATAVAPYSARARAGVPVSMPLAWSELKQPTLPRYLVSEFEQWRDRLRRDPWKDLPSLDQELPV